MGGTNFKWGGRAPLAPPLATALVKTGANPGGAIQAIAPPKTYELTLFTMIVTIRKTAFAIQGPFCHPLFCHRSVVKYTSSLLE